MNKKLREKAVKLRLENQMSYTAIRKELGIPKSALSYWLRDLPLPESRIIELRKAGWKKGEASRERYRNTMRRKREEYAKCIYDKECTELGSLSDRSLYIAGLLLYAAEGEKKSRYRIALANTDPQILCFFMWWMLRFLKVSKNKLRIQLHVYESMDIAAEERYWLDLLGMDRFQLYKSQIRALKPGSFSYRGTNGHGTCAIEFSHGPSKTKIAMAIKAFLDLHGK